MPLPVPNLDDRSFTELFQQAEQYLKEKSPQWSELSPADPGAMLVEVFAHLTTTMLYRLNRLPDKIFITLLNLIGVSLNPPAAARTTLVFKRQQPGNEAIRISRGTRVTTARTGSAPATDPPVFVTVQEVTIEPGQSEVMVKALNCEEIRAELVGKGKDLVDDGFQVKYPPLIQPTGDDNDLIVGVELISEANSPQLQTKIHEGKIFRIWRRVDNFSHLYSDDVTEDDKYCYIVDRSSGVISFAPELDFLPMGKTTADEKTRLRQRLGQFPPADSEIRVWYRRGGGLGGNVPPNTLVVCKDPVNGITVTNPEVAVGGCAAETLENALKRGPFELYTLQRTITARDFEQAAKSFSSVERARAFTQAEIWTYAKPGTVEVNLVPSVPKQEWEGGQLTQAMLKSYESRDVLEAVRRLMYQRRPLGTTCEVRWTQYKPVQVELSVVVHDEENPGDVETRIQDRLNHTINPLPSEKYNLPGWPFGQPLRVSDVYQIAFSDPGVRYVKSARFRLPHAPRNIRALEADYYQAGTWYAGTKSQIFRSRDGGAGWEMVFSLRAGETLHRLCPNPVQEFCGGIAAIIWLENGKSRVYFSQNCGEDWKKAGDLDLWIEDAAWISRPGALSLQDKAVLLVAADTGLFELGRSYQGELVPKPIAVNAEQDAQGYYALAVSNSKGQTTIAVAARNLGGVYVSPLAGLSGSFQLIRGSVDADVRVLKIKEESNGELWLWAGTYTPKTDDGLGCFRTKLTTSSLVWEAMNQQWTGGSCRGIAFLDGSNVLAATHRQGVMRLDLNAPNWQWQSHNGSSTSNPIPRRSGAENHLYVPVSAIAADPIGQQVLAGISLDDNSEDAPIYRIKPQAAAYTEWHYEPTAQAVLEEVTLPNTWLFISGNHTIEVKTQDEAERD